MTSNSLNPISPSSVPQSQVNQQPQTSPRLSSGAPKTSGFLHNVINKLPNSNSVPIDHKVSTAPSHGGVIKKAAKFFGKLFFSPKPEEIKFAEQIKEDIKRLGSALDRLNTQTQVMRNTERAFKGNNTALLRDRLNALSLPQAILEQSLKEIKAEVDQLQEKLGSLDQEGLTASQLANNYLRYDSLPKDIQKTIQAFHYISGRVTTSRELLKLDEKVIGYVETWEKESTKGKISTYGSQETWNAFQAMEEQVQELTSEIIAQTERYPKKIEKDNYIQKLLKKDENGNLAPRNAQQIIKHIYPALNEHVNRLFDDVRRIENHRIENLRIQTKAFKQLKMIYRMQAAKVNNLEGSFYNPSTVIKVFHRVKKDAEANLKQDLDNANAKLADTFKKMQKVGVFIDDEVKWLGELAQKHELLQPLYSNVVRYKEQFQQLKQRDQFSQSLDKLASAFKGEDHNVIREAIQQTLKFLPLNIQKKNLPQNFDQLAPIEQLKVLTKKADFQVNGKLNYIANLLQTLGEERKKKNFKISADLLQDPGEEAKKSKLEVIANRLQYQNEMIKVSINRFIRANIAKAMSEKISDKDLTEATGLIEQQVREYVKKKLLINAVNQGSTEEATHTWKLEIQTAEEVFGYLENEVKTYTLTNHDQELVSQVNQLITDFNNLLKANTNQLQSYCDLKIKTIQELSGGIVGCYMAAWDGVPIFRDPNKPDSLISNHTTLQKRDTINAESYQELIKDLNLLDQALNKAKTTLGALYIKIRDPDQWIFKPDIKQTPQTTQAINELKESVKQLKDNANKITWKSTDPNNPTTPGEKSISYFVATLDKTLRELGELEIHLNKTT